MKDWNNIIPEKDRQKFEEEERLKKEQEMFLAPRKRKKLVSFGRLYIVLFYFKY